MEENVQGLQNIDGGLTAPYRACTLTVQCGSVYMHDYNLIGTVTEKIARGSVYLI